MDKRAIYPASSIAVIVAKTNVGSKDNRIDDGVHVERAWVQYSCNSS